MENRKIEYPFIKVPLHLSKVLDVNCRSMMEALCQLESYYADENGIFFRTNADLVADTRLSEKLVRATIDTLYINGIIEVWSVGKSKGKHSNYYRLNHNKICEYAKYSMDELKQPHLLIDTIKDYNKKGYSPSYLKNEYVDIPKQSQEIPQELPKDFPSISQSTNNINNIDNKDNINNKENIDNIEIENNNIEESYLEKIETLFKKEYSIPQIFRELASTDWECYKYFRKQLKENEQTKFMWRENLNLLNELNEKYAP